MQPSIAFFWFCILSIAHVVYGYVVTHQLVVLSVFGSGVAADVGLYIFIILISAGLHAYAVRLEHRSEPVRLLSSIPILGGAILYMLSVVTVAGLAGASFDDVSRFIIPNWLIVALPIVTLGIYGIRRHVEASAVDHWNHVAIAIISLISGAALYVAKAQIDLSYVFDVVARFAIVLVGIVVPSFFFVSAAISAFLRRTESARRPIRTLLVAVPGALLVPLLPIIG